MERKAAPSPLTPEKLTAVLEQDYPTAEILVSFPADWEFVAALNRGDSPLYVAAFPASREPTYDRFKELSPEISYSLAEYRLYKLFEPWPQPLLNVAWDATKGEGQVIGEAGLRVQLHPIGQAQVWRGEVYGLLWECFFYDTRRRQKHWPAELARFWQAVEAHSGVQKLFTLPAEPTFETGYPEFLSGLGYAPDPEFGQWWSKELKLTQPQTIVEI